MIELTPTTDRTRSVAAAVRGDQLDAATPMVGTTCGSCSTTCWD